jgi:hypothetical protein
MIVSQAQSAFSKAPGAAWQANPLSSAVVAALEAFPQLFEAETSGVGLDVAARAPLFTGIPNRARMKIFSPKAGHTLVFFYKKSLVPYSRDRYSYGGLDLRAATVEPQEIAAWLDFLTSGFHPDKRPARLRRAFPYEIPE